VCNFRLVSGSHFQVFVNGVPQQEGRDFRRLGNELVFEARLTQEGGSASGAGSRSSSASQGRTGRTDSVDVVYDAGGRRVVASGCR